MDRARRTAGLIWLVVGLAFQGLWLVVSGRTPGPITLVLAAAVTGLGLAILLRRGVRQLALVVAVGLAIDFAGAVADRFGMFGSPGSPGVSWGSWQEFVAYTAILLPGVPAGLVQAAAVTATAVEVMLAAVLPLGWQRRWFAKGTAGLLVIYLVAMTASLGLDAVADYAVPILVGGAMLLSSVPTRREAHDLTNNRCRQRTELIAAPRPASPA